MTECFPDGKYSFLFSWLQSVLLPYLPDRLVEKEKFDVGIFISILHTKFLSIGLFLFAHPCFPWLPVADLGAGILCLLLSPARAGPYSHPSCHPHWKCIPWCVFQLPRHHHLLGVLQVHSTAGSLNACALWWWILPLCAFPQPLFYSLGAHLPHQLFIASPCSINLNFFRH